MSLADHYEDGAYFRPGRHTVSITGIRFFAAHSGTPGVEFEIKSGSKKSKITFWLSHKALPRLCRFAEDCGITKQQMRAIEPEQESGFEVFVGKQFTAIMEKGEPKADGKRYTEIVDFEPVAENDALPPAITARLHQPAQDEAPPIDHDAQAFGPTSGDEIPF